MFFLCLQYFSKKNNILFVPSRVMLARRPMDRVGALRAHYTTAPAETANYGRIPMTIRGSTTFNMSNTLVAKDSI